MKSKKIMTNCFFTSLAVLLIRIGADVFKMYVSSIFSKILGIVIMLIGVLIIGFVLEDIFLEEE